MAVIKSGFVAPARRLNARGLVHSISTKTPITFISLILLTLLALLLLHKSALPINRNYFTTSLGHDRSVIIAPENRGLIASILELNNLTVGAELGVQNGDFALHTLRQWYSCKTYYLVDIWAKQDSYKDIANYDNDEQEKIYQNAKNNLAEFKEKTVFLRMKTSEAAEKVLDESLDYIYVDARHDYCGVKEDIETWWSKLRPGGIMAGHDYIHSEAQILKDTNQDWSVCGDGSVQIGAVKGAVDEFALKKRLTIAVTYREPDWPSWMTVKPL